MTKKQALSHCAVLLNKLLLDKKLFIVEPYIIKPEQYFDRSFKIKTGISFSTFENEIGIIDQAWGIVFIDPNKPKRCTSVHTSYYGESVVFDKMLRELEQLERQ